MLAANENDAVTVTPKGLTEQLITEISLAKNEPAWMTDFRLRALAICELKLLPTWGADLSALDMNDIHYYVKPLMPTQTSWDTVPDAIKDTFNALGIPQAEQKYLAGVGAQYESEMVYKQLKKQWRDLGVLFMDMGSALREYPELFRKYFATVIPPHDNKFAALNSAAWSGGSFVYVPPGVKVDMPLQAYFRINQQSMGQFERTLIIADTNSFVHYVEGCSAPVYQKASLHSAVVELVALPGSHIRYTTIQNWSKNVYNLVTKRAIAYEDAQVEWIDGNFGSKVTMKYPCIILKGRRAKGTIMSIAVAGIDQVQDAGGKIIHLAPDTTSHIVSKSICKGGGRTSYRGLLKIIPGAKNARAKVQCDALILDAQCRTDTYPTITIHEPQVDVGHEASVSKISDELLFYMQARGLGAQAARALMINGFIDGFVEQLPMEYALEINRLINHEMEGVYWMNSSYIPASKPELRISRIRNTREWLIGTAVEHMVIINAHHRTTVVDRVDAAITTIIVEEYATVHYTIELATTMQTRAYTIIAKRGATARIYCTGFNVSGSYMITLIVADPSSTIIAGWASTTRGSQNLQLTSMQQHDAPHTTSRFIARKIVYDTALVDYKGMITISSCAVNADAAQDDATLLDGATARAQAVPAIEVQCDAVQCAHGSALGRLDAQQIWYMMSRGIPETQATQLCYDAFLNAVPAMIGVKE